MAFLVPIKWAVGRRSTWAVGSWAVNRPKHIRLGLYRHHHVTLSERVTSVLSILSVQRRVKDSPTESAE